MRDQEKLEFREEMMAAGSRVLKKNRYKMFNMLNKQIYKLQGAGYHLAVIGFHQGDRKTTMRSSLFRDKLLLQQLQREDENGCLVDTNIWRAIQRIFYQASGINICTGHDGLRKVGHFSPAARGRHGAASRAALLSPLAKI